MSQVRVLIVDDSSTMRQIMASVMARDPDIKVVGQAADAHEARAAIKELDPDVMTLDVEMPQMNGIEFLSRVMRLRPMPVIMVSTLTARGTETALEALEIGAFDCVGKPSAASQNSLQALPALVKAAAASKAKIAERRAAAARPVSHHGAFVPADRIVAIGSSTGGVEALQTVLSSMPENCAPTVITQHMPPNFTRSFAARLDRMVAPKVAEAWHGAPLLAGHVYLAPGGDMHLEVAGSQKLHCSLRKASPVNGHCPSVDVLFASVARAAAARAMGVILTGMGSDGAAGLLQIRKSGGRTIGQDEASSVVYGMPRVAFETGAVERQAPLAAIGNEIVRLTNAAASGAA